MSRSLFRFPFPELKIGTAEYAGGPTGCTLFYFPAGALAAVDSRGGSVAARELPDPSAAEATINALLFSGGSTYGLEATSGVMEMLLELQRGSTAFSRIPAVPAAVVYDFAGRKNSLYPDKSLGSQAFAAATENEIWVGRAGAGANVTVGKVGGEELAETSGQGAAFAEKGGLKILAVTVVNAVGNILSFDGQVLAGSLDRKSGKRLDAVDILAQQLNGRSGTPAEGNTTLSALILNESLSRGDLQRIATMAHTAMGRVIEPFHSPYDGDVLFALSTAKETAPAPVEKVEAIGALAGRLLQQAVLNAVESCRD